MTLQEDPNKEHEQATRNFQPENDKAEEAIQEMSKKVSELLIEVEKRIVGQKHIAQRLLMAMIAEGHVLLEGLPGLAKTTAIKTLAEVASLSFSRIQFTPDLLPADLIGTQIYDPRKAEFQVKKGPVFAHLILADEINRAPAKVQSALLEAMEERQVTIGENTWKLEEPFLVMATQNPIEQEGTYPLPEAQLDRFLFKLVISYTGKDDEFEVIKRSAQTEKIALKKIVTREDIRKMRQLVDQVYVSDKIRRYIVDLVFASRKPADYGLKDLSPMIDCGASPRASIALDRLARVNAIVEGRNFVTPQDVKDVGLDILRHRLKLSYEAEAEEISSDKVVERIFERIDVP